MTADQRSTTPPGHDPGRDARIAGDNTGTTARVVQVTRRGGPSVLAVREVRLPPPDEGEVLVRVEAAGVAFGDVQLREGLRRAALPVVPGYDVAGTVIASGGKIDGPAVGDKVAVRIPGGTGGYATHVLVPAWAAVPYPERLDPHAVVALVVNYVTAWQMLSRSAPVTEGSTILVHSAAGGVGSALLQLAALRGLRAFGTASAGKADLVRSLGATPIDYRAGDVAAAVRSAAPEGVDAVFDALGSASWRQALPLLRPGGRLVVYGMSTTFAGGRLSIPGLLRNFARLPRTSYLAYLTRGIGVVGYNSEAMVRAHPGRYREDLARLIGLLDEGSISPLLHRAFPLDRAAEAQAELGSGRAIGKITLAIGRP
jgi:NADPH:quinone reductase-like Zn-dependent oxidoreductase